MQDLKLCNTNPKLLSPIALAFIGDGVFELLVRERLLQSGTLPAHKLHRLTVKKVNAMSQAICYGALEQVLSEEEAGILKRGRNASTARVPKSCTPGDYSKATAIEALFGYLYLAGDIRRVNELFAVVDGILSKLEEEHGDE